MIKNPIYIFCQSEYRKWLYAHTKYENFHQENVLAQFMPSKSTVEKDYNLDQFCAQFHLSSKLYQDLKPIEHAIFSQIYLGYLATKKMTLKAFLHINMQDRVCRKTAYEIAHKLAERIHADATNSLRKIELQTE